MAVNFGHEYLKFEKEQKKLRKEYLAAGMTEAEADEMYDFDKNRVVDSFFSSTLHRLPSANSANKKLTQTA